MVLLSRLHNSPYKSRVVFIVLSILIASHVVGCGLNPVKVMVKPLTDSHYPPKAHDFQLDEWPQMPSIPHHKIAKLIATANADDEDKVRKMLMDKAKELGADGVVTAKVDLFEHMGAIHYQSTLNPEIRYSIFGGGGGMGFPMFFNPWAYAQTPADGESWTLYMDVIAIRYDEAVSRTTIPQTRPQ